MERRLQIKVGLGKDTSVFFLALFLNLLSILFVNNYKQNI
jgi:hypothetical protein